MWLVKNATPIVDARNVGLYLLCRARDLHLEEKNVKCLGVMLDDGLPWREQVQQVRKRRFIGLVKLR